MRARITYAEFAAGILLYTYHVSCVVTTPTVGQPGSRMWVMKCGPSGVVVDSGGVARSERGPCQGVVNHVSGVSGVILSITDQRPLLDS